MRDSDLIDRRFEAALPEQSFLAGRQLDEALGRFMLAALSRGSVASNAMSERSIQAHRLIEETKEWLFMPPDGTPFSFESICEVLRFDASRLRRALLR